MSAPWPHNDGPSWLQLEQRLLDELDPTLTAEVDAQAGPSLSALRADLRVLPPLDLSRPDSGLPLPDSSPADSPARPDSVLTPWRAGLVGALALAAAALLTVLGPSWTEQGMRSATPGPQATWKGGSLSLDLDRSREGEVTQHISSALTGDRLQVRLTCPPGERAWDLVVYQGGEASFPLNASAPLRCGNRVALPGAFTFDSPGPAQVCVTLSPTPRSTLTRGPSALSEGSVCAQLLVD